MEITLALLADAANVTKDGKLNVLGTFDSVGVRGTFPARHPLMHLVLRLRASPAEAGTEKNLEIKLLDEDGHQVGRTFTREYKLPAPPESDGRTIAPFKDQVIIRIVNTKFDHPGRYIFAVLVGGETKQEIPLTVMDLGKGERTP